MTPIRRSWYEDLDRKAALAPSTDAAACESCGKRLALEGCANPNCINWSESSTYKFPVKRGDLQRAPLGTKAPAIGGGYWLKVADGWKWFNGDTFPSPGGDWDRTLVLPTVHTARPEPR